MNKSKVFLHVLYLFVWCFLSCNHMVTIFYHDTSKVDDGDIWGNNLMLFFSKKKDISVSRTNSPELINELYKIKDQIQRNGNDIEADDRFYEFAFVLMDMDTLYTNGGFFDWRYKNRTLQIKSNIKSILGNHKGVN